MSQVNDTTQMKHIKLVPNCPVDPHTNQKAREHVRYATSTVVRSFFMDQAAVAAVVRQRGTEVTSQWSAYLNDG